MRKKGIIYHFNYIYLHQIVTTMKNFLFSLTLVNGMPRGCGYHLWGFFYTQKYGNR